MAVLLTEKYNYCIKKVRTHFFFFIDFTHVSRNVKFVLKKSRNSFFIYWSFFPNSMECGRVYAFRRIDTKFAPFVGRQSGTIWRPILVAIDFWLNTRTMFRCSWQHCRFICELSAEQLLPGTFVYAVDYDGNVAMISGRTTRGETTITCRRLWGLSSKRFFIRQGRTTMDRRKLRRHVTFVASQPVKSRWRPNRKSDSNVSSFSSTAKSVT